MKCKYCDQPCLPRKDRPGKFFTMCEAHLKEYKKEHQRQRAELPEVRQRNREHKRRRREKPEVREQERRYARTQSKEYYRANKQKRNQKNAEYRKTQAGRISRAKTKAKRRAAATAELVDRKVLFERDVGICQICLNPISDRHLVLSWVDGKAEYHPLRPSEDHIFPISRGGFHGYRNAQLAHLSCNQRKNAKLDSC